MGEVEYFVTHSAGHILCEGISRPLPNGEFERLTYQDIVNLLNQNERLKNTLAFRSNQLALLEYLIEDLGSEEMKRQLEEILNDQ